MFHPLNLEQQSAYFAADMEMLQRVRRVRPEDVDLPGQMVGQNSTTDQNAKQTANGQTSLEDREEKRKKLLKAQLKSAKMVVPPAPQIPKKVAEEHKKNGTQPQKEEPKKDNGKKKQPQVAERRESSGESGKRGRGSGMSRESGKRAQRNSRKRGRERSRESSGDRGRKTMRRSTRSRSVKRRRRDSSSSSYSSTSRSSRSRSYRRSPKRSPARDSRRDRRRRSTSNSSRSSSSSSASSSSQYSSSERSHSQSRSFTSDRDEEEERIRDRIIARTLSTSVTAAPAKQPQSKDDGVAMDEAMEYGPKPPESLEVSILNSDMEMSEEEEDEKEQKQQRENELLKVNQRTSLKREPSVELLNNVPEEGGKEHEKASPPKKAETQEVVAERGIVFSALEAQPQDVVIVVEHGMASPPSKVQPQSVVASTTNTQQTEKVTTAHRQSIFNVEEALVSGDIELIKQCKEKERERYDQLKLQIAELVMKKSVHKWNWTQLREAEKRILGRHTERTLSESSEDEAK